MSLNRTARFGALLLALVVMLSVFVPTAAAATATVTATVTALTTGNVMLRTGPGANYTALTKVAKGTTVTVLDNTSTSGWWKVNVSGQEGYITAQYLKISSVSAPTSTSEKVTKEVVTIRNTVLRTGPSRSYDLVTKIAPGEHVSILDANFSKTWVPASYNGFTGYIDMAHVKEDSLLSAESATATPKPTATPAPTATPKPTAEAATNAQSATGDVAEEGTKTSTNISASDTIAKKIASAKKINSDTLGWISVPGTNIDEPILYGANWYYANHNIYKKKSYEGVYPFSNRLTKNVVIFGHNLRGSSSVFHQLHHLQEAALGYSKCQSGACKRTISSSLKDWYKTSAGRTWDISIFGKQKWEVFAMYEVKANEPIATLRNNWNLSPSSAKSWIDYQLNRSEIKFGVSVSEKDQLMTLITCGTNYDSATANSRLFVFLKNVD